MANKKSKDTRPARTKYTIGRVWLKNKAKRIFKQMKKFEKYNFPANLKPSTGTSTMKVYIEKFAKRINLDISKRI